MKKLRELIETKVLNMLVKDDIRLWVNKDEILAEIDKLDLEARAEKVGCEMKEAFACVDKDGVFWGHMLRKEAEKWLKEQEAK